MKKNVVLSTLCSSLLVAQISSADTLAKWTFETSPPADVTAASLTGILADTGAGTASGVHASAATAWSTPTGNGSANSLSANTWAIGDYYQFSISTLTYEDIVLSWAQTSSGTGPGEFTLAYQVNGGGFTDFLNYTVLPNQAGAPGLGSWGAVTEILGYNYSVDLSAVSALEQATSVDFRLTLRTTADSTPPGTIATGGTSRVDNFTVTALPVPEPAVGAILCGFGLLGLFMSARRR